MILLLDLKIYKKIKERERQQRKEEIKTKIISKQQALIKEVHGHRNTVNIVPFESSNSFDDESLVKVRIKCISKEDIQKDTEAAAIKLDEKVSTVKYQDVQVVESDRTCCKQNYFNTTSPIIKCSKSENRHNVSKYLAKDSYLTEECKHNSKEDQIKSVTSMFEQSICKPILLNCINSESKSVASDPTGNVRMQSALSTRSSINSRHKSCKLLYYHGCFPAMTMQQSIILSSVNTSEQQR